MSDLRFRAFSSPFNFNKSAPSFLYGMDPDRVVTTDDGQLITGAMAPLAIDPSGRLLVTTEGINVSISGATFTASVQNLELIQTSGVRLQTSGVNYQVALSGQIDLINNNVNALGKNTGIFTSITSIITGSQLVVAAGYKSVDVIIVSGSAFIDGVGPLTIGLPLSYGGLGGGYSSSAPLVIGATGDTGMAACKVIVISQS